MDSKASQPAGLRINSMNRSRLKQWFFFAVSTFLAWNTAIAHTDIEVQIDMLSRQIVESEADADLYLKRGDLHRRHEDWNKARIDLRSARKLAPDHEMVDWYEGRLALDSGDYEQASALLSRYLETHPEHAAAWHQRAMARVGLGEYLSAAEDFSRSIAGSDHAAPTLYRSLVLTTVAAGAEHLDAASAAVDSGLARFPREVGLLGLGVDLSLAQSNPQRARDFLARIPPALHELPQWRYRKALVSCLEGAPENAVGDLSSLVTSTQSSKGPRVGTWVPPVDIIRELIADPRPDACANAAWNVLRMQQP